MNFWLDILIGTALAIFLYFAFRVMLLVFAEHEIDSSEETMRKNDAIEVFADVESLEYYVRVALAAADERMAVVVYVKKNCADKADMIDIISKLKKRHKNLSYRLI